MAPQHDFGLLHANLRVAFLGDEWTAGAGSSAKASRFASLLSGRLGFTQRNFGTDGAGRSGEPNRFTARVLVQRYEGAQTVYTLAVLGGKLAALELGSSARHPVDSEVDIVLPPALCWAYPDEEDGEPKQ